MLMEPRINCLLAQSMVSLKGPLASAQSLRVIKKWSSEASLCIPKLAFVLPTLGCSWSRSAGGCSVCGFNDRTVGSSFSEDDIRRQFVEAWENARSTRGEFAVDIYTGGSFLDPSELSLEMQRELLQTISYDQRVTRILIETRPEFVNRHILAQIRDWVGGKSIVIAVGLETSNDLVRYYCLNKGFTFNEFAQAADLINDFFELAVYLLLKPPFLNEREAIEDMLHSVRDVLAVGARQIIVIPTNVQAHTVTEVLWRGGHYRPPWLWSVLYLLEQTQCQIRIGGFYFDPTPLDQAHNCGNCDVAVINQILSGNPIPMGCACKEVWKASVLDHDVPLSRRIEKGYNCLASELGLSKECLGSITPTLRTEADMLDLIGNVPPDFE